MKWIYLIFGALTGCLVFIAAFSYGAYKFNEEPEFGSVIGMAAIFVGGVVAVGIIVLSIVVAAVTGRIQARKNQGEQAAPSNR